MIAPSRIRSPTLDTPTADTAAAAWIGGRSLEQLRDPVYMTEGLQWARYWAARGDDTPLDSSDHILMLRHTAAMLASAGADSHVVECLETLASGIEEDG